MTNREKRAHEMAYRARLLEKENAMLHHSVLGSQIVLVNLGAALDSMLAMEHKNLPPACTPPEEAARLLPYTIHFQVWMCWRALRLEHDHLVSEGIIPRVI